VTHRVGYPIASWFNRRIVSADFDATGRHIRASLMCDDGQGGSTPCYNGNTLVAPAVHLGRSDPLWEGAFSATATFMDRVRLYGLVDFKSDFKKWDAVTRVRCSLFNICLENADPLQFVSSNPTQLAAFQNGDVFGAEYIRDASFLRFREVSASVFLPDTYAQRIGASRATLTLSAGIWARSRTGRGWTLRHASLGVPVGSLVDLSRTTCRSSRALPPPSTSPSDGDTTHETPNEWTGAYDRPSGRHDPHGVRRLRRAPWRGSPRCGGGLGHGEPGQCKLPRHGAIADFDCAFGAYVVNSSAPRQRTAGCLGDGGRFSLDQRTITRDLAVRYEQLRRESRQGSTRPWPRRGGPLTMR
jgi:hypothetical protein